MLVGERIRVTGRVQGVGFRPFIWRLAQRNSLSGSVCNDLQGVEIEVWGDQQSLSRFRQQILESPPKSADIRSLNFVHIDKLSTASMNGFVILPSLGLGVVQTPFPDDMAICSKCIEDLKDLDSRYYSYPFTNCTDCGPRYSIVQSLPYDRKRTSMSKFFMCNDCKNEYTDPSSRRFHAQPIACPNCGPMIWLESSLSQIGNKQTGSSLPPKNRKSAQEHIDLLAQKLTQGFIVAIKSLGGFRLVCDASNDASIRRLRANKARPDKPLALMAKSSQKICSYVELNHLEKSYLVSPSNPIVLLNKKKQLDLPESIAPNQSKLGFMLPGSGLEHLLFERIEVPLVMTSGNRSGSPQCIDNDEAREQLRDLCDYFLMHDRDIITGVDDSVIACGGQQLQNYRRARGLSSQQLELPFDVPDDVSVVAMGGHKKSTFCISVGNVLTLSKPFGNLENYDCWLDYQRELRRSLNRCTSFPPTIVIDRHPQYLSTQYGLELGHRHARTITQVQHHHAHVAAVMVECKLPLQEKVVAITLDGMGMGGAEALWGGELFVCCYQDFEHYSLLPRVALPGGAKASQQPIRNLIAHLIASGVYREVLVKYQHQCSYLGEALAQQIAQLVEKQLNSPLVSSAGRLFDAVAAALDLCRYQTTFEGQAAMNLESLAVECLGSIDVLYTMDCGDSNGHNKEQTMQFRKFWLELFADISLAKPIGDISAKFHKSLAVAIAHRAIQLAGKNACNTIVLAGGVFQNQLLSEFLSNELIAHGLTVLKPQKIPANDASIALGQAAIALSKSLG